MCRGLCYTFNIHYGSVPSGALYDAGLGLLPFSVWRMVLAKVWPLRHSVLWKVPVWLCALAGLCYLCC